MQGGERLSRARLSDQEIIERDPWRHPRRLEEVENAHSLFLVSSPYAFEVFKRVVVRPLLTNAVKELPTELLSPQPRHPIEDQIEAFHALASFVVNLQSEGRRYVAIVPANYFDLPANLSSPQLMLAGGSCHDRRHPRVYVEHALAVEMGSFSSRSCSLYNIGWCERLSKGGRLQ